MNVKRCLIMFLGIIMLAGFVQAITPVTIGVNLLHNGANIDTSKKVTIYYSGEDASSEPNPVPLSVNSVDDLGQEVYMWQTYDAKSLLYLKLGIYSGSDVIINVEGYANYTLAGVTGSITANPPFTEININSNPTAPTDISGFPVNLYVGDTLTVTGSGSIDPDTDPLTYYYKFENVDNTNIVQDWSTTNSYTIQLSDAHDTIKVYTKAGDGTVNSSEYSETDEVDNSAPTTPTDLAADNNKKVGEDISAACTDSTDADGDGITYNYEFYNVDDTGIVQAYSADDTYTVQQTDAHNDIRVKCKANDGTADSAGEDEVTVSVANTAPGIDSIADIEVDETDEIVIQASATDADNDDLIFTINDSRFADEGSGRFTWTPDKFDSGVYDVEVTVSDSALTDTETLTVTVNDRNVVHNIEFVAGWNLFSLPVQPASTAIDDVLSSIAGKYDIVWTTDSGVWQSDKDFFGPLTDITPDKSYRVYMNQVATLTVTGKDIESTTINLVAGWNLVGYPSLNTRVGDLLTGKDYGIVWTTDDGVWQSDKDFFGPLTQFQPGYGYRIYASTPFSITVSNN